MTDEVGVVSGDLTVTTEVVGDQAVVRIQYTGADEWYTVTGSPLTIVGGNGEWLHAAMVRGVDSGLPEGLIGFELT
ncbi:hypothetical protein AB0O34_34770 [Sphaerisporangium sp. NPDC088356]|uniref:hypothetical protein n=1 Tax=Sphaerisporangium sp. NPDC088356 TaxID=3154871 RepID=UPI0034122014